MFAGKWCSETGKVRCNLWSYIMLFCYTQGNNVRTCCERLWVNDQIGTHLHYIIFYYYYYYYHHHHRPLHVSSNSVLIIRRSNCTRINTASGKWPSGVQVEKFLLNLHAGRPPTECDDNRCCINTILTSWWSAQQCSKHVEAYNKCIIKQEFVH